MRKAIHEGHENPVLKGDTIGKNGGADVSTYYLFMT